MATADRVRVEKRDGVADVRMVRGDKLNAVDLEMFAALVEAGLALRSDRSLRAVVLSGEGRAFCSGLDIPSLMAGSGGGARSLGKRDAESPANLAQRAAWVWQEVPVPVVAAVHGVAYGAGLQIALGADIRFVAPDARLSVRETHWGLIPDMGITQTLRHLVPLDVAKEMGLATHVSEKPLEDALALAREIAGRSPDALRAAKRLWNESAHLPLEEGLALEERLQRTLMGHANQLEAVRANLEKRAPKFSDPE